MDGGDCRSAQRSQEYLLPIATLYVAAQILSDVTAGKLISLAGLSVSITVIYFPVTFLLSDVLTEVYGYAQARRVVWMVLACSIFGAAISLLVSLLPPAPHFLTNQAYKEVLSMVPRVVLAGWIATWCGEMSNSFVLAKMKLLTSGRHFWARAMASTLAGQFINTALFYGIGLSGTLPSDVLVHSVAGAWLFKVGIELVFLPLTVVVVKFLKKVERLDHFDTDTDFSPLRVSLP